MNTNSNCKEHPLTLNHQLPIKGQIVKKVVSCHHQRKAIFSDEISPLWLPYSACISKGDSVTVTDKDISVSCQNGTVQLFPIYMACEHLQVGGLNLEFFIKEITEQEEFAAYQALARFHYRSNRPYGHTAPLIVRQFHPIYPKVIGYIELATPFFMNKARNAILNTSFKIGEIGWDAWNKNTRHRYIHLIVRIARCVIYPEFRGLGLGQLLVRHAAKFARHRWQVAGFKPYFLEMTADMLKFVPFAEKAGMTFIGETEGNLNNVAKNMAYLIKNQGAMQKGEIAKKGKTSGFIEQKITRMKRAIALMEREGWSFDELIARLEKLEAKSVLKDFDLFHDIVSLPKPTYLQGLIPEAETFLQQRVLIIAPKNGNKLSLLPLEKLRDFITFIDISISYNSNVRRTQQTHAIQQAFNISPNDISHKVIHNLSITLKPGEVVLITGPSGCGKTTFLNLFTKETPIELEENICLPNNYRPGSFSPIRSKKALVEILGKQDIKIALHLMGLVGLSDAFVYLKRFEELSHGQKYRAILAQLIEGGYNVWIADEFCANLDALTANVVAKRLQRVARQLGAVLIVASSQPEIFAAALCPDQVVHLTTAWEHQVMLGVEFIDYLSNQRHDFTAPSLPILAEYLPAVRCGQKCTTIRKNRQSIKKGILRLKAKNNFVIVNVIEARQTRLETLTDEDAKKDGFYSLDHLKEALLKHYPKIQDHNWVTIISFEYLSG